MGTPKELDPKEVAVLCAKLYRLEREAEDIRKGLDQLIGEVPNKFRKQLQRLSQEASHIHDEIEGTAGLHWKPAPGYDGPYD